VLFAWGMDFKINSRTILIFLKWSGESLTLTLELELIPSSKTYCNGLYDPPRKTVFHPPVSE
jgi:hypothetical protein